MVCIFIFHCVTVQAENRELKQRRLRLRRSVKRLIHALIPYASVCQMLMNCSRVEFSWARYLSFCLVFTCHFLISRFVEDVVVVQRRQRTLQKSIIHKFVILPIKTFPFPSSSSSSLLKLPCSEWYLQSEDFSFSTWHWSGSWSGSRSDPGSRPWSRYSATPFKEKNTLCRSYILTLKPGKWPKKFSNWPFSHRP